MNHEPADPDAIRPPDHLAIRPSSGRGRGVFATAFIPRGATIEVAPVIALSEEDRARIEATILYKYYFAWGPDDQRGAAIVVGYGMLYNHSYVPNAIYLKNLDRDTVDIIALRNIEPGEEITVNYNGDPTSREPLWFESRE